MGSGLRKKNEKTLIAALLPFWHCVRNILH